MTTARARLAAAAGVFALLLASQVPAAGAAGNADPGPPGNNGTVKLDGLDLLDGPGHSAGPNDPGETHPDNDPHLDCGLQLEFFGFDAGQLADITFTAHPPTGERGVLLAQQRVAISDDGAGGAANDPDVTLDYDVLADFDTSQFTSAHPVHGWHVRLDLTVYGADGTKVPGGQKHKVFWVEGCQAATPEPEPEPAPVVTPPADTPPAVTPPADNPAVPEVEEAPVVLPDVLVPAQPDAAPAAITPRTKTRVLPQTAQARSAAGVGTLARTGTDATTTLALVGLGLVAVGATLQRRSARTVA